MIFSSTLPCYLKLTKTRWKAHQDINLLIEPDQDSKNYDTLKEKESQLLLENEKVSKEHDTLMKSFKIFGDKIQSLQLELKQLNVLYDHVKEERSNLCKECSQPHPDYDKLEINKLNLWVECESYKKTLKFINDKLEKNDNPKGQSQDEAKFYQEIQSLRENVSKFFGSIENHYKLLR